MTTPSAALPPMDLPGRLDRLRAALSAAELEGLVVTKLINIRWLTGFTGSNALAVVTGDELVVVTDGRYDEMIRRQLDASGATARVEITSTDTERVVVGAVGDRTRIGLEARHVTWERRDQIDGWLPGARLHPTLGLIEDLRRVKDPGEVARLERAAQVADQALAAVLPDLASGLTEREVGQRLDRHMVDHGADEPSFDTIVGSGPNSALPHARPGDRVIEPGDLVVLDFGARIDGYGSDMTRTVVAGGRPDADQQSLYDAVAEAQAAGVAAVAAGVAEKTIDDACRAVLADHGLADAFIHGTGHGIGLEIHEDPILSPRSDGILRAGLVVTVEPGAYLPGRGGVRVEDSVVVGDDGCRPITHSPKGLAP